MGGGGGDWKEEKINQKKVEKGGKWGIKENMEKN